MFLIDDPTAVGQLPAPEAAGTPGYFFDGDPVNNKVATRVRASFLNMLMMEVYNVCTAGGVSPSKTTYNQLLTAIKNLSGTPPIWGKASTGSANAQVLTPTAPLTQLIAGQQINFISSFQNSGPVTLNISGLGAVPVKKTGAYGQMNFEGVEWQVNDLCTVVYDGSVFQWVDTQAYRQNGIGTAFVTTGWPTTDLNSRTVSGLFPVSVNSPNAPVNDYGWVLVFPTADPNYIQQEFHCLSSDRMFIRRKFNGAWSVWIELATTSILPAGFILPFSANSAPNGFLPCNGAAISRSTYSSLFSAIGGTYGIGDGSTTFNLPDLRGVFLRGIDNGRGLDSGRGFASYQADALQNITGSFWAANRPGGASAGVFYDTGGRNSSLLAGGGLTNDIMQVGADASRVVSTSSETRPKNIALLYCIKY